MSIADTATQYVEAGFSIIPIRADGSKEPALKTWMQFKDRRPTFSEIGEWFGVDNGTKGIGIIGGAPSEGLEILDFEYPELFQNWQGILQAWDQSNLLDTLIYVETPSNGKHAYYRCPTVQDGNKKLAERPAETKSGRETLIETRAHGGYVVAPGSPAACHPENRPYVWMNGGVEDVPVITLEQRNILHDAARSLNEMHEEKAPRKTDLSKKEGLPGDDFNERAIWADILQPHGWKMLYEKNGQVEWQRPGSTSKNGSARENWQGRDRLTVFTNSDPLLPNGFYSKFAAYTFLNHGGNFKVATLELAKKGFGAAPEKKVKATKSELPELKTASLMGVLENTDLNNARQFVQRYQEIIRSGPGRGNWFFFNGRHWEKSEEQVQNLAQDFVDEMMELIDHIPAELRPERAKWVKQSGNANRIEAILKLARSQPSIRIKGDEFDPNPYHLNVLNGVLDLSTGQLYPHDPNYMCSAVTDISWDPNARCPEFEKYLNMITDGHKETQRFLLAQGGLCLSGMVIDKLFLLKGKPRTGKTSWAELLVAVSGGYGCAIDKKLVLVRRNGSTCSPEERMSLFGKRFVSLDREVDEDDKFDETSVKSFTGGNSLQGRDLFAKPITFKPRCKFVAQGNSIPRAGSDEAFHDRMVLIPFDKVVPKEDRIPEFANYLVEKEGPGILLKLQQGFVDQLQNGLLLPDPILAQGKEYMQESDIVGQVCDECLDSDPSCDEKLNDIWNVFFRYCKQINAPVMSYQKFARRMAQRFGERRVRRKTGYVILGVRINRRYFYAQESFDSTSPSHAGAN